MVTLNEEIHNKLNLSISDKLTIIEQLIQQLGPSSSLKVVVNDDPMIPNQNINQQGNVVYTYELRGSKSMRKTQNNNLLQKLEVLELKNNQNLKNSKQKDNLQEQYNQNQNKLINESQKTIFRYFTENIKCFRCKKSGHFDYGCVDQFSCSFCLSSIHSSQKCPQKVVCFRCYQFGHMVNQCKLKQDGPFCQNCKRKHYQNCAFLMKGTQQMKQMFIMDSLYNHQDIRCIKCFKYGHFNCQSVEGSQYNNNNYKRNYQNNSSNDRSLERSKDKDKYHYAGNKKHKY